MEVNRYIDSRLNGTFSCYKVEKINGITYMFETKEEYDYFFDNNLSSWSAFLTDYVLDIFNKNKFTIFFVDTIYENGQNVADGTIIFTENPKGQIANTIVVQKCDNPSLILHEFGHFVDFCFPISETEYYSDSKLLKKIMLEELDSFVRTFMVFYHMFGTLRYKLKLNDIRTIAHSSYYFDPREYYAESFAMCCLIPEYMAEHCPKTYEYILEAFALFYGGREE